MQKYIVTLNIEEFKLLCQITYDKSKIRINPLHILGYDQTVFDYYQKILKKEILSASMDWKYQGIFIEDMGEYAYGDEFNGWKENEELYYNN